MLYSYVICFSRFEKYYKERTDVVWDDGSVGKCLLQRHEVLSSDHRSLLKPDPLYVSPIPMLPQWGWRQSQDSPTSSQARESPSLSTQKARTNTGVCLLNTTMILWNGNAFIHKHVHTYMYKPKEKKIPGTLKICYL